MNLEVHLLWGCWCISRRLADGTWRLVKGGFATQYAARRWLESYENA